MTAKCSKKEKKICESLIKLWNSTAYGVRLELCRFLNFQGGRGGEVYGQYYLKDKYHFARF